VSRRAVVAGSVGVVIAACFHQVRPFDHYLDERRWSDAAAAFTADSGLMNDEDALYRAGVLYGSPGRPTYDPERAEFLLRRLLTNFPSTRHRADALDRLELVESLVRTRDSVTSRQRAVESRIADLTGSIKRLRAALDSVGEMSDTLRRNSARLEADLRDRDEQLRALRLELQQLKEIDLKRPPLGPPRKPPF
jgi:hypothetical protein